MMRETIKYFGTGSGLVNNGILLALILFACQFSAAFFESLRDSINRRIAHVLQTSLTGAIYEKSFRVSPRAKLLYPQGKIVSMVGQDIKAINNGFLNVHAFWTIPLQLITAIVLMNFLLGWVTWIAVGMVILSLFINVVSGAPAAAAFAGYMKAGDQRTNKLREFLYGEQY
jgi:ABC-type transport system involved in cytochrome bd biosynthesis fused ATPase/permease subunit